MIFTAPERGRGHPSTDDAEDGEHDERAEHIPGRFVNVDIVLVIAFFAMERKKDKTEHVKRCEERGQKADDVKRMAARNLESGAEDLVLGEETGKRREA